MCGVLYRELTKFCEYTADTSLSKAHGHLFVLGTVIYLIIALFHLAREFEETKLFKGAQIVYNIGISGRLL